MASKRTVQITVEFPEELAKLNRDEVNRLKSMFKTETANILSSIVPETLLSIKIRNTRPGGGGSKLASARGSKKAGKKGAK